MSNSVKTITQYKTGARTTIVFEDATSDMDFAASKVNDTGCVYLTIGDQGIALNQFDWALLLHHLS